MPEFVSVVTCSCGPTMNPRIRTSPLFPSCDAHLPKALRPRSSFSLVRRPPPQSTLPPKSPLQARSPTLGAGARRPPSIFLWSTVTTIAPVSHESTFPPFNWSRSLTSPSPPCSCRRPPELTGAATPPGRHRRSRLCPPPPRRRQATT
jgi:hypothetical protein